MYTTDVTTPVTVSHKFRVGDKIRGRYAWQSRYSDPIEFHHEIAAIELAPGSKDPCYRYGVGTGIWDLIATIDNGDWSLDLDHKFSVGDTVIGRYRPEGELVTRTVSEVTTVCDSPAYWWTNGSWSDIETVDSNFIKADTRTLSEVVNEWERDDSGPNSVIKKLGLDPNMKMHELKALLGGQ